MTAPAADGDPGRPDGQSTHAQRIRVAGGAAFGVIGASLHVWGEDTLPYLLENWHDARTADPDLLRELPGRPLNARHEAVCSTGRAAELTQLHRWRRSDPQLAVRWLHGAIGTGKTCLAAKFASESAARNWKIIAATPGSGTVAPVPDRLDVELGTAEGVLLIVDDTDKWPQSYLASLLSDKLFQRSEGETRTRILMISRSLDDWPAVRHKLSSQQYATSSQSLEPHGLEHDR
jgi:hypothetical protein